jgi:hypothetical protein
MKSFTARIGGVAGVLVVGLAQLLLGGCSGSDSTFSYSSSTGTLRVSLTDKPNPDFDQVVVKIKEIRLVPTGKEDLEDDDSGLKTIPFDGPRSIDITKLQFQQELLGTGIVPAGSYSQVRLILEPNPDVGEPVNYVVLAGDESQTKYPLKTPSGQQSGVKVLGTFTVQAGVINAIMIDFDPSTAVVDTGSSEKNLKFILKPTGIRIVQTDQYLVEFGSVSGIISADLSWTSAIVYIIKPDSSDAIAAGEVFAEDADGFWQAPFTSFVPAGNGYRLRVQADGFLPYSSASFNVYTGADTDLGTISLTQE